MVTEMKVVVFKIGQEEYAIDIKQVISIERLQPITPIPMSLTQVKGMMDLRGEIVPVVDLRSTLSKKDAHDTEFTRIVAIQLEEVAIGLLVDEATDVIDIPFESIQKPHVFGKRDYSFIQGVIKLEERLYILLDVKLLIDELELLEEILSISEEVTAGV